MEIALGGLVLLLILLPGISYRKGYFSEEFSNQYTIKDFFQLFINTLFPSLIFYIILLPIIYLTWGYYYDFKVLLGILSSQEGLQSYAIERINEFKLQIAVFQVCINIFAFLIGYWFRGWIVSTSYDARNKFFRYKNVWHYILSAKFMLFERSQIELQDNNVEDVDITYIDALVVVGDVKIIYTGILVDYELSSDGSLDLLYIKNAQRKIIDESNNSSENKDINGNIIILKYEHIINLNLSFIEISIEDNEAKFKLIS